MWRGVSMFLAYVCIFLLIGGLVALILPRVIDSITALAANFSTYLTRFQVWADGMLSSVSVNPDISEPVSNLWQQGITMLQDILSKAVSGAVNFTVGLTGVIYNLLLSLMISGFILYNRKKLFSQFRRLSTVVLGSKHTRRIGEILRMANQSFSQFIVGQTTEALILGTLCFIGMSLLRLHYALLVSTIIAITALIPILGAWIGTIPCAVILMVIDPVQALWFLLFIIILQQIENNFIYPHVVGGAIGLPGLWVLLSIIIGGGLFGLWGMLLGTPVAALCYRLMRNWVGEREDIVGPPEP
jgi:predicted PurR-regulated permease PerM